MGYGQKQQDAYRARINSSDAPTTSQAMVHGMPTTMHHGASPAGMKEYGESDPAFHDRMAQARADGPANHARSMEERKMQVERAIDPYTRERDKMAIDRGIAAGEHRKRQMKRSGANATMTTNYAGTGSRV